MAKLAPTQARIFKNIFICKNCKRRVRAEPLKILNNKIVCRKCSEKDFRPIRKK
jgi:formylmethanofuran dehydrogenase subunit E